jgi:Flp pilus assembly protein TadD
MPEDKVPVYSWEDPNAAWVQVVEGIVAAAEDVLAERQQAAGAEPMAEVPIPIAPPRRPIRVPSPPRLAAAAAALALVCLALWWLLLRQDPALTARLADADTYMDTGRYAQALESYEAALRLAPGNAKAAYGRDKAEVLADMGPGFDVEAARVRLRNLEQAHPKDPHVQLMIGRLAAAGGDVATARPRFRRAIALDPSLPEAWFALGVLAHGEGRPDEARADYEKALALAPGHRQYATNLADLLVDQGDYRGALGAYEGILAVEPDLLLARLGAGNVARLAGDLGAGAWHHERLLKDLGRPRALEQGDNAAQWTFGTKRREVTMDAPESKRAYALLTVALTRFLRADEVGAAELRDRAAASPELPRALAVLDQDLTRLEAQRPEWNERISDFRGRLAPPAPQPDHQGSDRVSSGHQAGETVRIFS